MISPDQVNSKRVTSDAEESKIDTIHEWIHQVFIVYSLPDSILDHVDIFRRDKELSALSSCSFCLVEVVGCLYLPGGGHKEKADIKQIDRSKHETPRFERLPA